MRELNDTYISVLLLSTKMCFTLSISYINSIQNYTSELSRNSFFSSVFCVVTKVDNYFTTIFQVKERCACLLSFG